MSLDTHFPTNQALKKERIYIRYNVSEWQNNWPLHTHDGYEIYVFIQGNANYIIGDEIYQLQPGDMLLFSGDVHHRVNPARDTPYIRSYINFMPDFIQEMVGEELMDKLMSLFGHSNGLLMRWDDHGITEVNDHIMRIFKEREKEAFGSEFMMRCLLVQL
ncbi:MAG: AraC family transcriptional regulator, partial [Paenibacillus sp.]|nr:AraC family transcriptional regulator [Paenibacillus sp.]